MKIGALNIDAEYMTESGLRVRCRKICEFFGVFDLLTENGNHILTETNPRFHKSVILSEQRGLVNLHKL
jgi:hypothetical protein